MYKIIHAIVDHGKILTSSQVGGSIITCLAASAAAPWASGQQPAPLGGILANDSADKAARFIQICDAFISRSCS